MQTMTRAAAAAVGVGFFAIIILGASIAIPASTHEVTVAHADDVGVVEFCGGCDFGVLGGIIHNLDVVGGSHFNPPRRIPECTLTAVQSQIFTGSGTSLIWSSANITSLTIDHGVGSVSPVGSGSVAVTPGGSTTYTATGTGTYGTVTCSTTVTVVPPPQNPICTLTAAPTSITQGGSSILTWTTSGVSNFTIDHGVGSVTPVANGSTIVSPTQTTTYTGTGTVVGGPATFFEPTFSGYHYEPVASDALQNGGVVNWNTVRADQPSADRLCALFQPGSHADAILQTGSFDSPSDNSVIGWNGSAWYKTSASAYNHYLKRVRCVTDTPSTTVQCQATVTVTPPQTGCIQILKETFDTQGNPLTPVAQFTFKLDGNAQTTQNDGSGNATFTNVTPGLHTVSEVIPNSNWTQLSVTPNNGLVIVPGGSVCAAVVFKNQQVVTNNPPPTCTLSANPHSIDAGDTVGLTWTTTNATSITIDHGVGSVTPVAGGTKNVNPTVNTTYTATATGPGGTVTCSDDVVITPPPVCPLIQQSPDGLYRVEDADDLVIDATILGSQADYENSYGYYFADAGHNPISGKIIWANVKTPANPHFVLSFNNAPSNAVYVGFFIIPNGGHGGYSDGQTITFQYAGGFWKAGSTSFILTYFSDPSLNPGNKDHEKDALNVAGNSNWEDNFSVDSDFNDVKVDLKVNGCVPPPPQNGCIYVVKETFNTSGQPITPVAQFQFKLDGNQSAYNDAQGHATFSNVPAGTHTVTEVIPNSNWIQLSVTPTNGTVIVSPGSDCATVVFKNKQTLTNGPTCTLSINPTSLSSVPGTATLTWTSTNANTASIDQGVDTVALNGSTNVTVSQNTTYVGTFTGPNGTVTCQASITVPPPNNPTPQCTLTASRSQINPGESISLSWTSQNVTSGFISPNVGTTTPVASGTINDVFPSGDTTYTATFTGPYGNVTCSAPVTQVRTACTSNCGGGGLEQPRVVLFQKPGDQPLAFVSLSQIPYTGFEAGFALTMIFWLAVALLAALATYGVMGKGGMDFILGNTLRLVGADMYLPRPELNVDRTIPSVVPPETEYVASVAAPAAPAYTPAPAAPSMNSVQVAKPATDGIPDIAEVIESRAHGAGVLMSPEAVTMVTELSADRGTMLRRFGDILNEAVKTIPREDGWILLTSDRFDELLKTVPVSAPTASIATTPSVEQLLAPVMQAPAAPHASVVSRSANVEMPMSVGADQETVMTLTAAILSGNRDAAYATVRMLETSGAHATSVMTVIATALDQLYRARRHGTATDLTVVGAPVSDEALIKMVEVFTQGMDHDYTNPYTGVKLAIAQAFEARG